ncbi:MAG: hypothetical protein SNJ28_09615, partial [Rikenellaceae bacterium]
MATLNDAIAALSDVEIATGSSTSGWLFWKKQTTTYTDLLELYPELIDAGFKVFKLDRSNVKNWDLELDGATEKEAAEQIAMALNNSVEILKADRTESDLLYEVMLKL